MLFVSDEIAASVVGWSASDLTRYYDWLQRGAPSR